MYSKPPYRPEIDGLRAIAVAAVLIFHADLTVGAVRLLPGGFLGVDIFLVISGYLITGIILTEVRQGEFSFARFYERRARRILPALIVVIAGTLPFAWMWMTPSQFQNLAGSAIAALLGASNIFFFNGVGYFTEASDMKPLLHTWSLGVEEQFYALLPPAVMFITYRWRRLKITIGALALGILASLAVAHLLSGHQQAANFYLLPSRAWELLVGALIAAIDQDNGRRLPTMVLRWAPPASLMVLISTLAIFDGTWDQPNIWTVVPVGGTALFIWSSRGIDPASRLLSTPLFIAIGLISYSLYLWHWPLLVFGRIYSIGEVPQSTRVILLIASVVFAAFTWWFVERPFRNRTLVPRKAFVVGASISLVALLLFNVGVYALGGIAQRMSIAAAVQGFFTGYANLEGENCGDNVCVVGDRSAPPSFALVGDSHAGTMSYSLDVALQGTGISGFVLASGDIYLSEFPDFYDLSHRLNAKLQERNILLASKSIDTVILAGRYTLRIEHSTFDNTEGGVERLDGSYQGRSDAQKAALLDAIESGIVRLNTWGKKVVLVYPVPEAGWVVPETLIKFEQRGELPDLSTSAEVYRERNKLVLDLFDRLSKKFAHAIRTDRIFCNSFQSERCILNIGDRIFYSDDDHLSVEGSNLLVSEIVRKLVNFKEENSK